MRSTPRKIYGAHFTPREVFQEYIAPVIRDKVWNYVWVDMFAGKGDLILPILELVPRRARHAFFENHVYLFDIQEELVEEAVRRAVSLGIPPLTARRNIMVRDSLGNYPSFIFKHGLPVFHVTNPPYLYLGYIRKNREAWRYLQYFEGENKGYQDLYQLALINDARHMVEKMIYIVPSNFLYGFSVSNKIRMDLLREYRIERLVVFEHGLFNTTGTHVALCFFSRKQVPGHTPQELVGIKVKQGGVRIHRRYRLLPGYRYRAGAEFDYYVDRYRARNPLKPSFHLKLRDLEGRRGDKCLEALDANSFRRSGRKYDVIEICLDEEAYREVKGNMLFLRTLDTGKPGGKAGLYVVREVYGVDAIVVTGNTYRTHPIQLLLNPTISPEDQLLLKDYFNLILNHIRSETDSDFMTTYKYSKSPYTRKYLGLSQARRLIETFPVLDMNDEEKSILRSMLRSKDIAGVISLISKHSEDPPTLSKRHVMLQEALKPLF